MSNDPVLNPDVDVDAMDTEAWRTVLHPLEFAILREAATERPGAALLSASEGTVVATAGDEAFIWTWEGSTYTLTERVPIDEHTTIDVLADGTVGEHIEGSNTLRVRRPDGPVDFVGHASRVTAMSATGKPGVVATGAQDGTVILWRLDTAEALARVPCGDGAVAVLEYDPVRDALDVATFDGRFHSLALAPLLVDANRLDAGLRQDHGVWVEDAVLRLSGSEEE